MCLFIFFIPLLLRADINETGVVTVETKMFPSPDYSEVIIQVPAPLGALDYDFSTLGDEPFSITWKAPEGMLIEIAAPEGFDDEITIEFRFETDMGGFQSGGHSDSDPTISFTELNGTVPDAQFQSINLSGGVREKIHAVFSFEMNPGEVLRLESLTLGTTVPASYDKLLSPNVTKFQILGEAYSTGTPNDPGQWIRLVEKLTTENLIPEDPITENNLDRKNKIQRKIARLRNRLKRAKKARRIGSIRSSQRKLKKYRRILKRL